METSQFIMQARICHQSSRQRVDSQTELELLRETSQQALHEAWGENARNNERIRELERQIQEFITRETNYQQRIHELLQDARRESCGGFSGVRRSSLRNALEKTSVPVGPQNAPSKGRGSRTLDAFLSSGSKPRRQSSSGSVASASAWSLGSELRDLMRGKKHDVADSATLSTGQVSHEVQEMERKLEGKDTLVRNLEQAVRKHVKTILSLQTELERTKATFLERERLLSDKLKGRRETIARQVKDLRRYRDYVSELTNELEKYYIKEVTKGDSSIARHTSAIHVVNDNRNLSPSISGTRKTVAPFAA